MNLKKLLQSLKTIINLRPAKKCLLTSDDLKMADDPNNFYLRFESHDCTAECIKELISVPPN